MTLWKKNMSAENTVLYLQQGDKFDRKKDGIWKKYEIVNSIQISEI